MNTILLYDGGGGSFPPPPTRDALCRVRIPFQGFTARTVQFGEFPAFGPETTTLNDADLVSYCHQILAFRDVTGKPFTHAEIAVSWLYAEPGFLMPVPGRDLSNDLPELVRRIRLMISTGLTGVALFCAGDGRSRPKNPDGTYPYNDPTGHTYGYEWLMDNFPRIWRAVMAAGLNKYVVPSPGYDGVFYGWGNDGEPDLQPQRVANFGALARSVDPDICLAIEHTPGDIPAGGGEKDFKVGGLMDNYDVILSEYFDPITPGPPGGQVWEVEARMNPTYNRPSNQPIDDDPGKHPFYPVDSPRGPRYHVTYEFATRPWTFGWRTADQINNDRTYFTNIGSTIIC